MTIYDETVIIFRQFNNIIPAGKKIYMKFFIVITAILFSQLIRKRLFKKKIVVLRHFFLNLRIILFCIDWHEMDFIYSVVVNGTSHCRIEKKNYKKLFKR